MILMAFRHGLRAAELVDLRWDQVDLGRNAGLHVRRVKNGIATTHPLQGDEMRALRELKRNSESPFVFVSERGSPFTTAGFAKMVARLGEEAKFKFRVHPHMLRHACGYALANKGHDTRALQAYLGHKNIQHTVRYTELSPDTLQGLLERLAQTTAIARCLSRPDLSIFLDLITSESFRMKSGFGFADDV